MKPFKYILMAAALSALILLSGCSGQTTTNLSPQNPVTVELWHYYVGDNQLAIESAVSVFNQTVGIENGVIVEAVAMGSIAELEQSVTDSVMGIINSLPMPQIFSSYPDKAMEIDSYGQVVDLGEYFTKEEQALYISDFLADGIFEGGRLLVLPIVKSTELMYVNATEWDEFSSSEGFSDEDLGTWESLLETSKAYYNWTDALTPDIAGDGKAFMGFDSVANYVIIGNKQQGVDVVDAAAGEDGGATLNLAAMKRVFENYYTGISMGYYGAEGKFRSDDIKSGALAAYVGSSSSAAYFPTWIEVGGTQSPIEFSALTYPSFEGSEPYAMQQGAGMCIAKSTPAQQEGAVLFLKWFTASEQNISFAMTTGYLPVQSGSYSSQQFTDALSTLSEGEESQQNVYKVYEIALRQITEANTYAAKPFTGSYDVRSILQSTLIDIGLEGKQAADGLKAENLTEEEIIAAIDPDAAFDRWMEAIKSGLTNAGIYFIVE